MSSPTVYAPWARDAFLEGILGKTVYRLAEPQHAKEALESVSRDKSWMIETKVPVNAPRVLAVLADLGFRLIDTNVQFDSPAASLTLNSPPRMISVREARIEDRPTVERIAVENLITSRFHLDPAIGPELGSRIKGAWVGNYFEGRRGNGLLVVEHKGVVGGFLLVLESGSVGTIDLIALDPALRGLGAVEALIAAWLAKVPAIERVVVGTQISNHRSLRSYGKVGFRVCGAAYVLHCHGFSRVA